MAGKYLTMGPGSLTFGEQEKQNDCSAYVRSAKIATNTEKTDSLLVLSGDTIPGDRTYTFSLEVEVLQTTLRTGLLAYSWENAGNEVLFTFSPKAGQKEATINGKVVVDPIELGGEVGSKPTATFTWECVGKPSTTWGTE